MYSQPKALLCECAVNGLEFGKEMICSLLHSNFFNSAQVVSVKTHPQEHSLTLLSLLFSFRGEQNSCGPDLFWLFHSTKKTDLISIKPQRIITSQSE